MEDRLVSETANVAAVRSIADKALATRSWERGFHGVIRPSTTHAIGTSSLRDVALARRSLGLQRMDTLTTLPVTRARVTPSKNLGSTAIGAVASLPALQANPRFVLDEASRRRPGESVPAYIDRRLIEADILFLPNRGRMYSAVKRALDIIGSLSLIILLAPVLLALVVLIRLDSPGPAIFVQQRVSLGGRTFSFYKFRTMWVDARERFPELYAYNFSSSAEDTYYKLADDARNSRVGRWLRRTTLDELPNLFNVLKGDMSLVGPRPELPELVEHYRPEELACFFTKAGVTGLAQVAGRSLLTMRERLTLDLRYVAQQTTVLDLRIMWRTLVVVVTGRGAF